MPTIFQTAKFKLRQPTGHKARVLAEVSCLYRAALQSIMDETKAYLPGLEQMEPKDRAGHRLEAIMPMPVEAGIGLHSSLRAAAQSNAAAMTQSYLELKIAAEKSNGKMGLPTWPGDSENPWPEYERVLGELALIADNLERETELRNELAMASFRVKEERRHFGDVLWFPRMDGARHARNAALLTDGKNYYALLFLLAPDHSLAKPIKGNGKLREVGGDVWLGRSKCAIVMPLAIDRHDWQQKKFLMPVECGEMSIQTGQLFCDNKGSWYFAVQFARQVDIEQPSTWLGLAFDRDVPTLVSPSGEVWRLADSGLASIAALDNLLRASLQSRGKDISYHRVHGTTAKQVIHIWANAIVEYAKSLNAGIAISGHSKPSLGIPRAQLQQAVQYKLALAHLPLRIVSAKDAAWFCPVCGQSLEKGQEWLCPACQLTLNGPGVSVGWHLAKRALVKYGVRG